MRPRVVYILGGGHRVDDTYAYTITPPNMHFPFGFSLKFRYLPQSRLFDYQELRLPFALRPISDLIALFRIPRADIYLLQSPRCLGIGIIKKKLFGAKLVMMNGDQFFYSLPRMSKWKAKIFNSLIQNVDGIISYSQLAKDWAERYTKVPNELVYPYTEVEQFIHVEPDLNSHNLFFLGTLTWYKGIDLLVEAFKLVREKFPDSELYLCGRKDLEIKETRGIHVLGFVEHPQETMKKCSVYVNAARMEPFGINVIEGMCAGLIPVVTENVGAKDAVQRLEPSLIVKTDSKRIAEKVIEIFEMSHGEKVALSKKAKKIGSGFSKKKGMADFERSFWNIVKSFQVLRR